MDTVMLNWLITGLPSSMKVPLLSDLHIWYKVSAGMCWLSFSGFPPEIRNILQCMFWCISPHARLCLLLQMQIHWSHSQSLTAHFQQRKKVEAKTVPMANQDRWYHNNREGCNNFNAGWCRYTTVCMHAHVCKICCGPQPNVLCTTYKAFTP